MDVNKIVSTNLKTIRESKKLSLDQAAKLTGVSKSMLGQIERGDTNPTISVLWKIANGLKVSFTSIIEKTVSNAEIIRYDEIVPLKENDGKYINYSIFSFDESRRFETYHIEILPEGKLSALPHLVGTEEYITVFGGQVSITLEDEQFDLGKGDSIRFKADVPHSYHNKGNSSASLSMTIYYSI